MFNMFAWFVELLFGLVSLPILVYPFAAATVACCFSLVFCWIGCRRSRR